MCTFSVPGTHGKCRPRFARGGAVYRDPADSDWEAKVAEAYRAAGGRRLEGPVAVTVDIYRPLPKGRPKRVASEPDTARPDADNILKAVMDALNGVAYHDDSQVAYALAVKHDRERGVMERTEVEVLPMPR